MRVLFFIYSLGSGGAERVTTHLATHWVEKGWDVSIATMMRVGEDFYVQDPRIRRISLDLASDSHGFTRGLWANLRRVRELRKILRGVEPDIVLAMMSTASVLLALSSWGLSSIRVIGSERTLPSQFRLDPPWETLRRRCYRRLDAVVALTEHTAGWLRTHTNAKLVKVIPNMATWPLPAQAPRILPDRSHATDRRVLLSVGRLNANKGYDRLLDVFAQLAPLHEDWDLVILGDGPERAALEDRVSAASLEGRVALPGLAGNVGEWYESADLYVLCSHFEGFPNVLAEAMAHGVPAVSFDCDTGPRDIIRDGIDGLLVPPQDVLGLRDALDRLMSNNALRAEFARRSLEIRDRLSIERISGLWEELFATLKQR